MEYVENLLRKYTLYVSLLIAYEMIHQMKEVIVCVCDRQNYRLNTIIQMIFAKRF